MAKLTPMMEQYFSIKKNYENCLLMFRLGDFYELFYEDAITASKELDITLTGRDCGQDERAPMCGVPYHAVDSYIYRLVEKNYKVAICEQVSDPRLSKDIVKREVVRVITPGTILDANALETDKNNYLMCIYAGSNGVGVSYADITTGEFHTTEFANEENMRIIDEISRLKPKEIIINSVYSDSDLIEKMFGLKTSVYLDMFFDYKYAYKRICDHFKVINLAGFGLEDDYSSVCASGALLEYLLETQKNSLKNILSIKRYHNSQRLLIDASSRKNLELTENIRDRKKKGSLLAVLDRTKTAMGARLIRKWIETPLIKVEDINKRLESVEEFERDVMAREEIRGYFTGIQDFERLTGKIVYKTANPRDLTALRRSFQDFPEIKESLKNFKSPVCREIYNVFDDMRDIYELLCQAFCDEPPISTRDGGFIRDEYNPQLDEYRQAKTQGGYWLEQLLEKEKEITNIKNLKIGFNKIFGYYLEVTNSYKTLVPDRYTRKQTLSNCERYITPELKEIEENILGADSKIVDLEYSLYLEIIEKTTAEIERIHLCCHVIAVIDVLQSLGDAAEKNGYVCPEINDLGTIDIKEGRHPVLEKVHEDSFVSNDTFLDLHDNNMAIITGPNMGGKSTYMRQTALIVLMAQVGSFVPALSAKIGVVDKIFTRAGASDDLAMGQSTFMVEMSEVANIINSATSKSLIIFDEIGRGTSTYDGLSLAWSILEYTVGKIGAKTLFATHYHELTELEGKVFGVKNYNVLVQENGDDIIFLRKIVRGGSENSYGIYVAKLAGFPEDLLERSKEIHEALNSADIAKYNNSHYNSKEDVSYKTPKPFDYGDEKIFLNELLCVDMTTLTPRDALVKVTSWYERYNKHNEN